MKKGKPGSMSEKSVLEVTKLHKPKNIQKENDLKFEEHPSLI